MAKQTKKSPPKRDPYQEREQAKYDNPIPSREYLLELLAAHRRPLGRREIADALGLESPEHHEALRRRLRAMERDGQLVRNRRRGYLVVDHSELVRGRVMGRPDGSGFLLPDGTGDRLALSPRQMRCLLHGDRAVARITGRDEHGTPQGELVEILERGNRQITGRFFEEHGVGFLVPENKRLQQDVLLAPDGRGGAEDGELAVAEILAQPNERRQPIGRIIQVLGRTIHVGEEDMVAARIHGIPMDWPAEVEKEVAAFGEEVPEADKEGRTDLRRLPLVTIDGADAKDFDDALYCEPTAKGWRLVVAIADVSHYVRPGTALDQEARLRGNSVYFPRSVVPMLPEALSNGLCSLNPKVDRLAMVCDMLLQGNGKVLRSRFYRAVIQSAARLTYEQAAAAVVDGDRKVRSAIGDEVVRHLENLHGLYKTLRKARDERGAIDFDTTETEMRFDDEGRVVAVEPTERNDFHKVVEECMIAANVCTAKFLLKNKVPSLYRVHERPGEQKLEQLKEFLAQAGLELGGGDEPTGKDYGRIMEQARERPDRHLIETVLLRSMQAAEYRPDNAGHFGLALEAYTHFTSPIRRYPDLVIHRGIGHVIDGHRGRSFPMTHNDLVTLGEHCSMAERRADEATRDAEMTLKCEYLSDHLGDEFTGVIAAVTSFGLFVSLEGVYVDGLVHITNLESDFFHFDSVGHRLVGDRTGKEYRLSDRVRVRVGRVDKDDRKIDLEVVAHPVDADGEPLDGSRKRGKGGKSGQGGKARSERSGGKQSAARQGASGGRAKSGRGKAAPSGSGPSGDGKGKPAEAAEESAEPTAEAQDGGASKGRRRSRRSGRRRSSSSAGGDSS
ncbi:ribonuclease R [Halorhodospira halophila]|uniref:Ribonuclease R n=1 Tax=Halorhodospira halophila (strain DSM 244 / SL1) TaxID=349124 RepID=A1WUS9_HALHL|nr:ribonuclease R [Halorhodospira halophila]ABM61441.1 RNAse R [Halorhodospira halophila SL1]MBK1728688.1 ribonuclease R [Halorhodospira halophila]